MILYYQFSLKINKVTKFKCKYMYFIFGLYETGQVRPDQTLLIQLNLFVFLDFFFNLN